MQIKVSDYIIDSVAKLGVSHVFLVSGGGGMFLLDSLGKHETLKYVCNHHEQASIMSAEGYQRASGNIGVALVTTGPAATNALTGVLCAWNDSIPLLIISGQANSKSLIKDTGLRQRGVHEVDIVKIVQSVTKYAVTILDEKDMKREFEKAIYLATQGRPGPVWIDIPIDIQSKLINVSELIGFVTPCKEIDNTIFNQLSILSDLIANSKRPIVIAGHGIRLANQLSNFFDFIEKYNIPIVTTKNGMDIVNNDHELLAGRIGTYGQRAGNFAVQNADLIIALGTRLSYPTTGYETQLFGRGAKIISVDIDQNQQEYLNVQCALKINLDLKDFFDLMNSKNVDNSIDIFDDWIQQCKNWRIKYPPVSPHMKIEANYVNSYYFFEKLSDYMSEKDFLVADQGATFYSFTVAFKTKKGQRAFTNGGFSPMGYGLPAAIGASFSNQNKRVICVHGDGGLMMNLQELETIRYHKLPMIIFVFNNDGYLSIKHTQNSYFNGFYVGSDPSSGVSMPDWSLVANAFGLNFFKISTHNELNNQLLKIFASTLPVLVEVMIDPLQAYEPKVMTTKTDTGKLVSKPLEDMSPLLGREEFYAQMIIPPVNE